MGKDLLQLVPFCPYRGFIKAYHINIDISFLFC